MSKHFEAPPLNDDEMRQLKELLLRYLAYHAAGLMNVAIDSLLSRFRKDPKLIEQAAPEPPASQRKRQPKATRGSVG